MNTKLLTILACLWLLLPGLAFAQDDDIHDLLIEFRAGECPDYILNAEFLIPQYNDEGRFDSIYVILDFIEDRCGPEHFADYKILHAIEIGDPPENLCENILVDEILDGEARVRRFWGRDDIFSDDPMSDDYEFSPYQNFIRNMAESLLPRTDTNSITHLVCRHLAGDNDYVMRRLSRREFDGTCLQKEYDKRITNVDEEFRKFRLHAAGGIGIWIPRGESELLGNKLEISGELGGKRGRFGFDLSGAVRLLESREFYELYYNEQLVRTDDYIGGYIGGTISGELLRLRRYGLDLFAGGGYDGFSATIGEETRGVDSYNINFGLRMRYQYNKERNQFFGLQLRYNIVDYDTNGGSDLSGNTISLNVIYGYLGNRDVTGRAKRLRYYDR